MATQLFLVDTSDVVADTHLATNNVTLVGASVGWATRTLSTSRGVGAAVASSDTSTVAGPTNGIEIATASIKAEWISPPLSADVTIAGTITGNIWASENNMSANVSICMVVEVIRANVLGTANSNTIVEIARRAPGTEIAVTTRAVNNFTMTPTSTVVNRGDRLRVRVFGDDVTGGVNMAATFTFNIGYGGETAAADGDTYITFTENFSFESAPGVLAQTLRDSVQTVGNVAAVTRMAQPFVAQSSTLTEVRAWLSKTAAPTDDLILEIQGNSSGAPDGVSVGTVATVAGGTLTTTMTEYTYGSLSITLTSSATYWLVLRRSTAVNATNYYNTGYWGAATVPGWTAYSTYDGSTWAAFVVPMTVRFTFATSTLYLTNTQSGLSAAPALISSFTGSDENPLSEGGNWANLNTLAGTLTLQRISNSVAGVSASSCASYWTPANFGADVEAYVTLSTFASLQGIAVRIQGEGGSNTWDGYSVIAQATTNVIIRRVDNGTNTTLVTITTAPTWASGDKLGVRVEGSTIQAWRQASGSSEWNLLCTAVDATYASAGKVALIQSGTTGRLDDFYAATDSNLFTQKAWTSRGAGVVSYLSDTDAGWTAPLYTHDWYTPGLTAFTLTGMAQANIRALESNASANATLRCEIARVESDGTSPTVWANWAQRIDSATGTGELPTAEAAQTINVSGDDLAISNGQRLRIRIYSDDMNTTAMGNAFNTQVFYNGTSAAASGDSYVTLAQTVSEFASGPYTYTKAGYGREAA